MIVINNHSDHHFLYFYLFCFYCHNKTAESWKYKSNGPNFVFPIYCQMKMLRHRSSSSRIMEDTLVQRILVQYYFWFWENFALAKYLANAYFLANHFIHAFFPQILWWKSQCWNEYPKNHFSLVFLECLKNPSCEIHCNTLQMFPP